MPAMLVVTPVFTMRAAVLAIVLPLFAQVVPMRALRAMVKPVSAIAAIIVIPAVMTLFIAVAMSAVAIMGVGWCRDVQEKRGQWGQQDDA